MCLFQLSGFGMSLLQNVDPNPENFVCAGIVKARTVQIGSLLRLEPNRQAQVRETHQNNHLIWQLTQFVSSLDMFVSSRHLTDCDYNL